MEQREIEACVAQMADSAEQTFGAHLDRALLEAYAREAVLDVWLLGGDLTSHTAERPLKQIQVAITRRSRAFMAQAA